MFDKKKDNIPQEKADMNSIEKYISSVVIDIKADIDRLKAHTEAEKEIRQSSQERFSRLNETIGELREMLIDSEKKYQTLEEKTTKAIDLMDNLKPEKIDSRIASQNMKIEREDAKTNSNALMVKNLIDELKSLKISVSQFKGVNKVIDTADKINKDLGKYKKMQSGMDRSASKVENIFIEVQENFNEFQQYRQNFMDLENNFIEMVKDFDLLKIEAEKSRNLASTVDSVKKRSQLYEDKLDNFIISLEDIRKDEIISSNKIRQEIEIIEKMKEAYKNEIKEKNSFVGTKIAEFKKIKENYEKNMTEQLEQFEKKIKLKAIEVNKLSKILDEKTKSGTTLADKLTALENPKGNFISRNEFEKANLDLNSSINEKIKSLEKVKDKLDKKLDSELKEQTKNGKKIAKKMNLIESTFIARSRAIDELDGNMNEKFKQIENDIALRDELQKPNISLQKTMIEEKIKNAVEKIRIESGSDIEKKIADMKENITAEMEKNIESVNLISIDLVNKKISQLNDKVNALGLIQNKISGIENALDTVNKKTDKSIGELPGKKIVADELNFIQKIMDEKMSDMESRFTALESVQSKSREREKQIKTSGIPSDDLSALEKMISSETKEYAEQAFLESNAKLQKQIGGMKEDITREMNETIESVNLMSLGLMKDKVNELQVLINEKTKKYIDSPGNMIIE